MSEVDTDSLREVADHLTVDCDDASADEVNAAAEEIEGLRQAIREHRDAIRDGVAEYDWPTDPADWRLWRAAGLEDTDE